MTEEAIPSTKEWDLMGWGDTECGCSPTRTCFKHKLRSIQFAGRGKTKTTLMEAQWDKDMPAYQRLRRNGLQPPSTKGCAELEKRANSQHEIEMGHLFDRKDIAKVEEGMALSRELEWSPPKDEGAVDAAKKRRLEGV